MSGGRVWLTRLQGVTSRNLQMPFMSLTQILSRPLPQQSNTLRSLSRVNMRWTMKRSRADDTSLNNSLLVSPACDVGAIGCNAHIIDANNMFRGANLSLPYPTIVWKWLISKCNLICPWEWICNNTMSMEQPWFPKEYPSVDDDHLTDLRLDWRSEGRTFPQDEALALLDSNKTKSITAELVTQTDAAAMKPIAPTPPPSPANVVAEGFDMCSNENVARKRCEEPFLCALNETYWKLGAPLAKKHKNYEPKTTSAIEAYRNAHLSMPNQLTFWKWLMKRCSTPPIATSLYSLVMPSLRGKQLNVQQQSTSLISFMFYISGFSFKQCSAPKFEYWRNKHHPKREVVRQALAALVPTSSIVVFTEIGGGPLRDMQETLKRQYGFDHHVVEMRLAETSVTPKRAEALTHSSRGHNLVAWDNAMFRRICFNDMTLLRWTFPGVVLQHRETGEVIWMVGLHLTPRREHRALLKQLDTVGKHCLPDSVRDRVARIIAVGDLNVQYTKSFGRARLDDKRYLRSIEYRRTVPNRRIKLKPQTQRQTKSRTEQKHRTTSLGEARMKHKRRIRPLKSRRTELKRHRKVKHRIKVKRCTKSDDHTRPTKRLNALGAFVASSDGTAQSEIDTCALSCESVKIPKKYPELIQSTDHRYWLRVPVTLLRQTSSTVFRPVVCSSLRGSGKTQFVNWSVSMKRAEAAMKYRRDYSAAATKLYSKPSASRGRYHANPNPGR